MKPLTVYKASAGSGKTFTLAAEFIKLLLCDPQKAYRTTLAVTFTNKATEEMKMRILSQLYGIANGLSDSDDYVSKVKADLKAENGEEMSDNWIRERARMALTNLLHNYSYFKVQTIDAFFQSVLRNLAHELDLTANMRVAINQDVVETEAVNQFIESLTQSSKELKWILSYIQSNIDKDKQWDILGDILKFGKNIFQDVYKENRFALKKFIEDDTFVQYNNKLRALSDEANKTMKAEAEAFFSKCNYLDIQAENISNGNKSVWGYFLKISNGCYANEIFNSYVSKQHDSADAWVKKPKKKSEQAAADELRNTIELHLLPLLRSTEEKRKVCNNICNTVNATLKNINELRLLHCIEQKMEDINTEMGRIMLSDTQHMLHEIMKDDDAPFVFEKIGSRIEHIMIDEFQDTSLVQWNNFLPLLQNTMSQSTGNLIVGDVKQSIYRWRSGDWRLLNNIGETFSQAQMQEEPMEYNFRSEANIIHFNNNFFTKASTILANLLKDKCGETNAQQITTAYNKVTQKVPDGKASKAPQGYVEINLLPKNMAADEFMRCNCETVAKNILLLREKGASLRDMAIIVRKNKEVAAIASYFMEHYPDITLVSAEAFNLEASKAVLLMISAMRWIANATDNISMAYVKRDSGVTDIEETLNNKREQLCSLPVYELVEELYDILHIAERKGESAYVCDFMDRIANFVNSESGNLSALLDEWDNDMHKQSIESDDAEGIRLLTIHKSKGLEYSHVFLPLCNWSLTPMNDSLLWCKPSVAPFNELPIVALNNNNTLLESEYKQDKVYEQLQQEVDDLNMLYVAFTRASENLFVIGKTGENDTRRSRLIERVLDDEMQTLDDGTRIYTFGNEPYVKAKRKDKESQNIFMQQSSPLNIDIKSYASRAVYRQSNKSELFVGKEEAVERQQYIECGNILHEVFRNIATMDDISMQLRKLEMDGLLYGDAASRIDIERMIRSAKENDRVREWFDGHWKLYRECSILVPDPNNGRMKEQRPDRVMTDGKRTVVIDYKSGVPHPNHREQVLGYIDLLQRMGMPNVEGWLWYINDNKTIEVR